MRGIVMALFLSTGAYAQELVLSAPLEPLRSLTVRAGIAGQVVSVHVQEGQRVVQGDTLAVLENQDLRLDARTAALEHKKSQAQLHRARAMHDHGLISAEDLESAEFIAHVAALNWQAVRMHLDRLIILATIDGLVSKLSTKRGHWLSEQAEVACIIEPDDLLAHVFVPEDRLTSINVGLPVQALPVGLGGDPFAGEVVRISPVIDPENGACRVTVVFLGAGRKVKPGALVDVHFGAALAARRKEGHSDGQ